MPTWCDMKCEFAEFPKDKGADGSGSCRTFIAIFCRKLKKIVPKNGKCPAGKEKNTSRKGAEDAEEE